MNRAETLVVDQIEIEIAEVVDRLDPGGPLGQSETGVHRRDDVVIPRQTVVISVPAADVLGAMEDQQPVAVALAVELDTGAPRRENVAA